MYFHQPVVNYLNSIKYPAKGKSPYSARYIGSMVADVHRTLLYGGIFGYPDDKKSKSGKLRLLYEAFPMAFLTEQVRACLPTFAHIIYTTISGWWCRYHRTATHPRYRTDRYPRTVLCLPW